MNIVFSDRTKDLHGSAIRAAFKAIARPGMISFAGGMPSPDLYPNRELAEISRDIFLNQGPTALQYGITEGYAPLIEQIKERLKSQGAGNDKDSVIVVSGGQQGIELVSKALLNEGDGVACEIPSFVGALNCFRSYNAKLYGVPMDEDGMNIDKLDETLSEHKNIKLIYTIPTFQNPSGRTMSLEKRKQLLEVAKKHGVFIIEDNPYGELRFAGTPVPTVKSMDTDNIVIYAGSFSKIIAPGLRVGFLCADSELIEKCVVCKQVSDVHTNVISQMMISEYIKRYDLDKHIKASCESIGKKCALMKECIEKYFPKNVKSTSPEGGLFLWCDPCDGSNSADLNKIALENNVAIVPGASALTDPNEVTSAFRLNYSMASDEQIKEGIEILGKVLYNGR